MIRAVKDMAKIIWNGMTETRERCREYCEKGMLQSCHQWLEAWKQEDFTQVELEEGIMRCSWEISQMEKKILLSVILYIPLLIAGSMFIRQAAGSGLMAVYVIGLSLLLTVRMTALFKRRFRLTMRAGWLKGYQVQKVNKDS